jgi:hypothetical protein
MPPGWVHETIDLIAYGRIYRPVHQNKDAESQRIPGLCHRQVNHEYYQKYLKDWDFNTPFPDNRKNLVQSLNETKGPVAAEELMASDGHDYFDKLWDQFTKIKRDYSEGFFAWLLYNPQVLECWADVDVIEGRIGYTIDGQKVWEKSPETITDYKRLHRDVSRHHIGRLRKVIDRYSDKWAQDFLFRVNPEING